MKHLDRAVLEQFTGSDNWYKHALVSDVSYTDGVKYVAEQAEAYWLIDEIAISQLRVAVAREEFQVWKLKVQLDTHHGELVCEDGNGEVVYRHVIEWTDFPVSEMQFYVANDVIMLPTEY